MPRLNPAALCNDGFLSRVDAPAATQALLAVTRRVRARFPALTEQPITPA